jgi:hypothetical protein
VDVAEPDVEVETSVLAFAEADGATLLQEILAIF